MIYLSQALLLIVVLIFAVLCIFSDIKTRKISNNIVLGFLFVSLLFFCFFIWTLKLRFYLVLLIIFSFYFVFYSKKLLGGADVKILMISYFLIASVMGIDFYVDFMINLLLFYSFCIIFIAITYTSLKSKLNVIKKKIDYEMILFQMVVLFVILRPFIKYILSVKMVFSTVFIIFVYTFYRYISPRLAIFFSRCSRPKKRLINLGFMFIFLLININSYSIIVYFLMFLFFRLLADFISNMIEFIDTGSDEKYSTPFSMFIFYSIFFTFLINNNLVSFLLKLGL